MIKPFGYVAFIKLEFVLLIIIINNTILVIN
jgi:hypothetical protein